MISKSLSTSQRFADLIAEAGPLGEFCQLLFPLIVAHADDFGRLQGDPFTVKHQCHPTSARSVDEFCSALLALHQVGLIQWFSISNGNGGQGRKYIQVVNFEAHQQGLHKRTRSAFPRVPDSSGNSWESPGQLKGTKENLTKGKRSTDTESSALAELEPALLTFPTVGVEETSWSLTESQAAEWRAAYPGIDILAEARKALAWLRANKGRQKTARGMPRFLVNWLNRANDSRRGGREQQESGLSRVTEAAIRAVREAQ